MTFTPILPLAGLNGFRFLEKTEASQRATFNNNTTVKRDIDYFKENISSVKTPADLVSDYRLLRVALGAFDLTDDLPSKAFVRTILEEGTLDSESLANRMTDTRYRKLSKAFGFDLSPPRTQLSTFASEITTKFQGQQFETAVGQVNDSMRLALNARRELSEMSQSDSSAATKWFTILGTPPLREVIETAFGLPNAFGSLDLDRQKDLLEQKSLSFFGTSDPGMLGEPDTLKSVIERYMIMDEISTIGTGTTASSPALILLGAL